MRNIEIRLKDENGKVYRWSIEWIKNAYICGQARHCDGWQFKSHDNVVRFIEGKWRDLVPQFKMVAKNYGLKIQGQLS